MRRILAILFVLLCVPAMARAACTGSSPTWTAAAPTVAAIGDCITAATAGDTINVPAGDGTETWTTQLVITKGVQLIGPGATNLTITNGYGIYLIYYSPSSWSSNSAFRISGFTFNQAAYDAVIYIPYNDTDHSMQTNVRIDHNVFTGTGEHVMRVGGDIRGVFDHNTVTNVLPFGWDTGYLTAWDDWEGVVFGKADNNFYVEDNTFTVSEMLSECQNAGRFAFRYNTVTSTHSNGSYGFLDSHGNQPSMQGCFGGEIYGNHFTIQGGGGQILTQRGGRTVTFYNLLTTSSPAGNKMYEDTAPVGPYCDSTLPCTTCTYAQNIRDTYTWANWSSGGTLLNGYIGSGENPCTDNSLIEQNVDFWNHSVTYNGTVPGVGCGAARPAVCTTGDGYWETAQSCTSLTGLVGASHTSNITGTFYRCTATNTWSSAVADGGFTPYTYPHRLQGVTAPTAPTNVRIR